MGGNARTARDLVASYNNWSDWATVYAAIVATGALFLELRRWFESGVRLRITYMLNGVIIPSANQDQLWIFVTVSNRGDSPTTITNLGYRLYESR